jgi:chloride channel protein, CIC family
VTGEALPEGPRPIPSYAIYQRRSPAIGQGRVLLVLSQPETADILLRFAAAIARYSNYELECLEIIGIPRHKLPAETPVQSRAEEQILDRAMQLGRSWGLAVHTQIRVAHDPTQAMLEVIEQRHIRLLLLDWADSALPWAGRFGTGLESALRDLPCDLLLVRPSAALRRPVAAAPCTPAASAEVLVRLTQLNRWLIPVGGGPHAQAALELLPALVSLSRDPDLCLCQVYPPTDEQQDTALLRANAALLEQSLPQRVRPLMLCAPSVAEALIDVAENQQCDVIVLGASEAGLVQQALKGNIPGAIARHFNGTILLVRKAGG